MAASISELSAAGTGTSAPSAASEVKESLVSRYWSQLGVPRKPVYRDSCFTGTPEELEKLIAESTTLYVGNLSFYTTEEQILELFSQAGEVSRIIMGLDRVKKTPCGFCFVEYYTREDAEQAMSFINGTMLDDREVRTDWDAGISEDRQYGRGRTGGQVRDDYRLDHDPGRGGAGAAISHLPAGLPPAGIHELGDAHGNPKRAHNESNSDEQQESVDDNDDNDDDARNKRRRGSDDQVPSSMVVPLAEQFQEEEEGEVLE
mmetsp:Transcript_6532/g.19819  ORF Transcript_6532/g.19819 Transcript_6532/m.19819 type:complete len:260 (+) Transcript_6532:55-834(+)|eukprot:CAMPEP_0177659760 /NCGR_PEP_ID=MMETSP0447-20121125/17625_1 /TAXON_ID=0 /ORGANISM="Stygamoeba regulata, Strain BSH-02190019" /LENGTH=259 /DNA_ID=CAMNT_0019164673 /DNA_START=45 /DNA_END=824 /DNA_ORIENTATION=-